MKTGQQLTELRRSNASGVHAKHSKDRANASRQAIEEAMEDEEDGAEY